MRIKETYKIREIADEYLIVNQGQPDGDMTQVISLNDTAVLMWRTFEGREFTAADVAQMLMDTFGIGQALADKDAIAWTESLKRAGAITD